MREPSQVELPSLALTFHELRAPLGFVASAARLMADEAGEPLLRDQAARIERAANRMLVTAKTVLSAAADVPPAPVVFDAMAAIRRVTADMSWLDLRIELISSPTSALVRGAPEDLECLLSSLLLNAGDHGDRAHPVRLAVRVEPFTVAILVINRCAAEPRHRGQGLGSLVLERLAARLGAAVASQQRDGWFTTTIELQSSPAAAGHTDSSF